MQSQDDWTKRQNEMIRQQTQNRQRISGAEEQRNKWLMGQGSSVKVYPPTQVKVFEPNILDV